MVFQKLFGGERKPFLELSEVDGDQPTTTVAPAAPASKPVATAAAPAGPQAVTLPVPLAQGAATATPPPAPTPPSPEPSRAGRVGSGDTGSPRRTK